MPKFSECNEWWEGAKKYPVRVGCIGLFLLLSLVIGTVFPEWVKKELFPDKTRTLSNSTKTEPPPSPEAEAKKVRLGDEKQGDKIPASKPRDVAPESSSVAGGTREIRKAASGLHPSNDVPRREEAQPLGRTHSDTGSSGEASSGGQVPRSKVRWSLEGVSEAEDRSLREALGAVPDLAMARITITKSARDDSRNVHIAISYEDKSVFTDSFNTPQQDASDTILSTITEGKRRKQ